MAEQRVTDSEIRDRLARLGIDPILQYRVINTIHYDGKLGIVERKDINKVCALTDGSLISAELTTYYEGGRIEDRITYEQALNADKPPYGSDGVEKSLWEYWSAHRRKEDSAAHDEVLSHLSAALAKQKVSGTSGRDHELRISDLEEVVGTVIEDLEKVGYTVEDLQAALVKYSRK